MTEKLTHCQVCGRDIKTLKSGKIAHHGFERPGWGYQTDSCMGAKHVPYELGTDALEYAIEMLDKKIEYLYDAETTFFRNPPRVLSFPVRGVSFNSPETFERPDAFDTSTANNGHTDCQYTQAWRAHTNDITAQQRQAHWQRNMLEDRLKKQPAYAKLAKDRGWV